MSRKKETGNARGLLIRDRKGYPLGNPEMISPHELLYELLLLRNSTRTRTHTDKGHYSTWLTRREDMDGIAWPSLAWIGRSTEPGY